MLNGKGAKYDEKGMLKESGEYKDNILQHGEKIFEDGRVYRGSFEYEGPNGKGEMIYPDGERYEGDFKNGLFHGEGKYTHKDGRKFYGEYVNNS